MSETAKMLEPGFSVADAEYLAIALRDGTLILDFVDWREVPVRVLFLNAAGVRWQELDSRGPEERNDSIYEIVGSSWLTEYLSHDAWTLGDALRHFRLCFNACGVLDVLASSMDMGTLANPASGAILRPMWGAPDVKFVLRPATSDDVPALETLIAESAHGLGQGDYSPSQIQAAIGTAWAVDRQLIQDGTFWIAEILGEIIGCGGWSRRRAVVGSSATVSETDMLSSANDAARIRAFFVHSRWARRGIGTALLKKCEEEARAAGFRSVELLATLPGERLYASRGYTSGEPYEFPLGPGQSNTVIPMWKRLHDRNDGA